MDEDPGNDVGSAGMALHLITIKDRWGRLWLGPAGVDQDGDLEAQGCWRCALRDLGRVTRQKEEGGEPSGKAPNDERGRGKK